MKRSLFSILMCASVLFTLVYCERNNDDDDDILQNDGILTATINEASTVNFEANYAEAVFTKGVGGSSNLYSLFVTGNENNIKRNINFSVYTEGITTTGTYPLKFNLNHIAYYFEDYGEDEPFAWISPDYSIFDTTLVHGTITFNEISITRTSGTFQFTAKEDMGTSTRTITNGTFDVPLRRQGF